MHFDTNESPFDRPIDGSFKNVMRGQEELSRSMQAEFDHFEELKEREKTGIAGGSGGMNSSAVSWIIMIVGGLMFFGAASSMNSEEWVLTVLGGAVIWFFGTLGAVKLIRWRMPEWNTRKQKRARMVMTLLAIGALATPFLVLWLLFYL